MSKTARPQRKYDAPRRKKQAEETRKRVVEAAARVFVDHGYAGATIPGIAVEAGVALQTVYRAAPGKAGLLGAAVMAAVAGGATRAERPVDERPAIRAVIEEPDPNERLRLYARTQPGIWSRVGPLWKVLEAAADSEPELRQLHREQTEMRHAGLTRLARTLRDQGALRPELTPERAADLIVTLGSLATYDSLVVNRGWTQEEYETWLAETLQHNLLRKPKP